MLHSRVIRLGGALSLIVVGSLAVASAQTPATAPPPAAQQKPPASLPEARTLIDRHIAAIGGREAILAVSSTHMTGTIAIPAAGLSGTLDVYAAKPNLTRLKMSIPGFGDAEEGFDGKVAWGISPATGPALSTGKELEQKTFDADFYRELRDPSRYQSITTVEQTTFAGEPAYKVRLVSKSGVEDFEYYAVDDGLKIGGSATRETPMGTMSAVQTFGEYKKYGALMHPSSVKITTMGVEQVITVTGVEYNNVQPAMFEPPAAIKALIK